MVPEIPEPGTWFGLTIERAGKPVSIGLVYLGVDGRWWVSFKGESRPLSMQKGARELLMFAGERGIALHALCDLSIPGSLKWMRRWAFEATGETINGQRVYRWALN